MASIHKEMLIAAPVDQVWAAVRDIGGIHTELAREFVADTRVEGTSRLVTFAAGWSSASRSSTSTIVGAGWRIRLSIGS
jgi:hypothetical protein